MRNLDVNFNAYFIHVLIICSGRLTCEMSVQENTKKTKWMQAKPWSNVLIM